MNFSFFASSKRFCLNIHEPVFPSHPNIDAIGIILYAVRTKRPLKAFECIWLTFASDMRYQHRHFKAATLTAAIVLKLREINRA